MDTEHQAVDRLAGPASERLLAVDPAEDAVRFVHEMIVTASMIPGVGGAGLMLADEQQVLRYAASTDAHSQQLERAQQQVQEGPCIQAYTSDAPVCTGDLEAEERWPALRSKLDDSPIRAVLTLPVHAEQAAVGTLHVYTVRPHEWQDAHLTALTALGAAIDGLLTSNIARHRSEELAGQLQRALDYRAGIERAVGYLMAKDDTDAVTAFNRLRDSARSNRRRVADVARDLLDGHPLPPSPRRSTRRQGDHRSS